MPAASPLPLTPTSTPTAASPLPLTPTSTPTPYPYLYPYQVKSVHPMCPLPKDALRKGGVLSSQETPTLTPTPTLALTQPEP